MGITGAAQTLTSLTAPDEARSKVHISLLHVEWLASDKYPIRTSAWHDGILSPLLSPTLAYSAAVNSRPHASHLDQRTDIACPCLSSGTISKGAGLKRVVVAGRDCELLVLMNIRLTLFYHSAALKIVHASDPPPSPALPPLPPPRCSHPGAQMHSFPPRVSPGRVTEHMGGSRQLAR